MKLIENSTLGDLKSVGNYITSNTYDIHENVSVDLTFCT